MTAFADALSWILSVEGGYAQRASEPGGAVNFGVSQTAYDTWRRSQGLAPAPVRGITPKEVEAVYYRDYWTAGKCDALAEVCRCISLAHFDACVHSGPKRAGMILQEAAGVTQDGAIGPVTLGAVRALRPGDLVERMIEARRAYLVRVIAADPGKAQWRDGWMRRLDRLKARALGGISVAGGGSVSIGRAGGMLAFLLLAVGALLLLRRAMRR